MENNEKLEFFLIKLLKGELEIKNNVIPISYIEIDGKKYCNRYIKFNLETQELEDVILTEGLEKDFINSVKLENNKFQINILEPAGIALRELIADWDIKDMKNPDVGYQRGDTAMAQRILDVINANI